MLRQSNKQTIRRRGMDGRRQAWMVLLLLPLLLFNACASVTPAAPAPSATSVAASATPAASPVATTPPAAPAAPEATSVAPGAGGDAQAQANVYTDPQNRFSVPVPTNWQAEQRDGFVVLSDPDQLIAAYALVVETADPKAALAEAWQRINPTATYTPTAVQEPPPTDGAEQLVIASYDSPPERVISGRGTLYQGTTYVLLVDADGTALAKRQAQVDIIESGYTISAIPVVDLRGVTPAPVDEAITAELAAFTERMRMKFKVPGVAVAVVQDGEVVYSNGFGVRNAETKEPLTPQTRMMIGSTGKSLTTMMMATLVDAGKMSWDTPARQILPSFAVKDAALTQQITMRNLVCACTGVPRRDLELIFNAREQSAEDVIASLASFEFFTRIGEAFQYSNQMVATGGYLATVSDGHAPGNLLEDYGATLKARVLDPIGMPNTTLAFADVAAGDNYAVPHSHDFALDAYLPRPLNIEQVLSAGAPAGAHWSTAEDMANYLITQLNRGVAPNGTRVVSAENLEETWRPQVPVDATTQYGLGWFVGDYKQQRLIAHGGNTLGFTSDFAFLPDANLGIVVLANGYGTNEMNEAIRTRLFELVFQQPEAAEATATFALEQANAQTAALATQITGTLDGAALTPLAGRYTNDALGELMVTLDTDALVVDAGEFQWRLKPVQNAEGPPDAFILVESPLPGMRFTFTKDAAGKPTLVMEAPTEPYTFTKSE